jgi:triphosphoribosyl-dephospho-CoA synthase
VNDGTIGKDRALAASDDHLRDAFPPGALSLGQCATLGCFLEAAAPKPGNVHRGADFEDLSFVDLAMAGALIAPAIDQAILLGVGATALKAIRDTRWAVPTNANLGIVLLVAPLACVPRDQPLREGVARVLASLTPQDSRDVYEAIRLARPGGLGKVNEMDVAGAAPENLLDAMRHAADRDLVARQYANGFVEVLDVVLPTLVDARRRGWSVSDGVVHAQLVLLSQTPDTLIARKCGLEVAQQASDMAAEALAAGEPHDEAYLRRLADLDFWMRSDGHRRNPGATADLVAAALFASLRDGLLSPPWR